MKVLAVEDDDTSRLVLLKVLEGLGHEVKAYRNGADAWADFVPSKESVIVSDWTMPEMDGLDLCRRIRAERSTSYCYFILLTARSRGESLVEAMDAGVDDYLAKPLDSRELAYRLRVAARILGLKSDVQSLRALLPICAWCKSIRDDGNLWQSVEEYMRSHSMADLTHAICPKCLAKELDQKPAP